MPVAQLRGPGWRSLECSEGPAAGVGAPAPGTQRRSSCPALPEPVGPRDLESGMTKRRRLLGARRTGLWEGPLAGKGLVSGQERVWLNHRLLESRGTQSWGREAASHI